MTAESQQREMFLGEVHKTLDEGGDGWKNAFCRIPLNSHGRWKFPTFSQSMWWGRGLPCNSQPILIY
jgi:hypothetical protein